MLDIVSEESEPGKGRISRIYHGIQVELLYRNTAIPFIQDNADAEVQFPTYHLDPKLVDPASLQDLGPDDLYIRIRRKPSHDVSKPLVALWFDPKVDNNSFRGLLMREGELERVFKLEPELDEQHGEESGSADEEGLDGRFPVYEEDDKVRRVVLELYECSVVPSRRVDPQLAHYNGDMFVLYQELLWQGYLLIRYSPLTDFDGIGSQGETSRPRGGLHDKDVTFLPRQSGQEADCTWTFHLLTAQDINHIVHGDVELRLPAESGRKLKTGRLEYHTRTKTPVMAASSNMVICNIDPVLAGSTAPCEANPLVQTMSTVMIETEIAYARDLRRVAVAGTDEIAPHSCAEKERADVLAEEKFSPAGSTLPSTMLFQPQEADVSGTTTRVSEESVVASAVAVRPNEAEEFVNPTDIASKTTESDPPDSVLIDDVQRATSDTRVIPQPPLPVLPVRCDSRQSILVTESSPKTEATTHLVVPIILVKSPTPQPQICEGVTSRDDITAEFEHDGHEPSADFLLACLDELVQEAAAEEALQPARVDEFRATTLDLDRNVEEVDGTSHEGVFPEPIHSTEIEDITSSTGVCQPEQVEKRQVDDDYRRHVLVPSSTSPPPSDRRSQAPKFVPLEARSILVKTTEIEAELKREERYRSGKRLVRHTNTGSTPPYAPNSVTAKIGKAGEVTTSAENESRPRVSDARPKKRSRLSDIPMWTNVAPGNSDTGTSKVDRRAKHFSTISAERHVSTRTSTGDRYGSHETQTRDHRRGLQRSGQERPRGQRPSGEKRASGPFRWPHSTLVRRGAENGPSSDQREIVDLTRSDTSEEARRDVKERKRKRDREDERYRTRKDESKGRDEGVEERSRYGKRKRVDKVLNRRSVWAGRREVIDLTED